MSRSTKAEFGYCAGCKKKVPVMYALARNDVTRYADRFAYRTKLHNATKGKLCETERRTPKRLVFDKG